MIDTIRELITHNQFASGGILVVALTAVWTYLRSLPRDLWRLFLRNFTNEISFLSSDSCYEWVERWFSINYHPYYGRYMMTYDSSYSDRSNDKYYLAPNYGWYFRWYKWRVVTLNKTQDKVSEKSDRVRDKIDIRLFGGKKILESFLEDLRKDYLASKKHGMKVYTMNMYGDWNSQSNREYVNQPILPKGIYQYLTNDLNKFITSYDDYKRKGILYKRNYMFYGIPGTGKSSTIARLAFDLKKDIYILNIHSGMTNTNFIEAVGSVPHSGLLVIEDIDCLDETHKREKEDSKKSNKTGNLNLSTILNTLDGFNCPNGLICFITTNKKEELDSALVRPGRIDVAIEFVNPGKSEVHQLYNRLTDSSEGFEEFFQKHEGRSMAELQTLILQQQVVNA